MLQLVMHVCKISTLTEPHQMLHSSMCCDFCFLGNFLHFYFIFSFLSVTWWLIINALDAMKLNFGTFCHDFFFHFPSNQSIPFNMDEMIWKLWTDWLNPSICWSACYTQVRDIRYTKYYIIHDSRHQFQKKKKLGWLDSYTIWVQKQNIQMLSNRK